MAQQSDVLLRVLTEAQVEFIIIGGVAANVHGSTYPTRDLDVMAPLSVENCSRILQALAPYEPRFYQAHGKPRVDRSAEALSQFRGLYLSTTLGIVDLLKEVPPLESFEAVAARSTIERLFGLSCRVLSLDDLIAVKTHVARPKDKAVEIELRAIRERQKSQS